MRYTAYTLQVKETIEDLIGQRVETWINLEDIRVATSQTFYEEVVNDVLYRKYAPTGITPYKGLLKDKTYRIVGADRVYEIESFNVDSRLTQLMLKEVV